MQRSPWTILAISDFVHAELLVTRSSCPAQQHMRIALPQDSSILHPVDGVAPARPKFSRATLHRVSIADLEDSRAESGLFVHARFRGYSIVVSSQFTRCHGRAGAITTLLEYHCPCQITAKCHRFPAAEPVVSSTRHSDLILCLTDELLRVITCHPAQLAVLVESSPGQHRQWLFPGPQTLHWPQEHSPQPQGNPNMRCSRILRWCPLSQSAKFASLICSCNSLMVCRVSKRTMKNNLKNHPIQLLVSTEKLPPSKSRPTFTKAKDFIYSLNRGGVGGAGKDHRWWRDVTAVVRDASSPDRSLSCFLTSVHVVVKGLLRPGIWVGEEDCRANMSLDESIYDSSTNHGSLADPPTPSFLKNELERRWREKESSSSRRFKKSDGQRRRERAMEGDEKSERWGHLRHVSTVEWSGTGLKWWVGPTQCFLQWPSQLAGNEFVPSNVNLAGSPEDSGSGGNSRLWRQA
ncbi:hypothetical protein NL676_039798 [Syzygium grande]|nr:hypothetical protein NL676_039798 [Syzygium grande]